MSRGEDDLYEAIGDVFKKAAADASEKRRRETEPYWNELMDRLDPGGHHRAMAAAKKAREAAAAERARQAAAAKTEPARATRKPKPQPVTPDVIALGPSSETPAVIELGPPDREK